MLKLDDNVVNPTCPYKIFQNKYAIIKEMLLNKITSLISLNSPSNKEKITFKKWAKILWMQDVSDNIPVLDENMIDELYLKLFMMTDDELNEYISKFKTVEWFNSSEHMLYSEIQWRVMEDIIHEIMDELVIDNEWKYELNSPEFDEQIWLEIDNDLEKFNDKLFQFFKIKIFDKIKNINENTDSKVHKLLQIVKNTDLEYFLELFLNSWIWATIANNNLFFSVALEWINKQDWVILYEKLEECAFKNSNNLIIDLARSNIFLLDLLDKDENILSYNPQKNCVEFTVSLNKYKREASKKEFPFNQYKSCPMIRSKSKLFWKKTNKIMDFNRIVSMFFMEFYKKSFFK